MLKTNRLKPIRLLVYNQNHIGIALKTYFFKLMKRGYCMPMEHQGDPKKISKRGPERLRGICIDKE